ncbi:MAG: cysteine--tRNA ligase [Kiritimatiellae bacterium]|jgi:cysteinyl-tRNA synthetase|nr:cysteine--tRNA ligase [Kiritimatiellia bacterium]MDD4342064.1 cysteine--tRNA ligase [Kiritimatiellia bacterium]MDY0148876.1 cysteine--tRNA ligase [Kiritimatiellia bacterium]
MSFRVYNTLTRRLEEFVPQQPGHARLYTCGPTVYNIAHIGNFRAYVFEDLLRRWLQFKGFRVTQVMNLTDVDDKTIRDSQAAGQPLTEFTAQFKHAFFDDIRALNIEPAEHYPAATDHIPEMIHLIQVLLDKGYAYQSDDGSIYFSIDKWPSYGKLAQLNREGMRPGARITADEYDKENVADFALWKAWDEQDGDVAWESPWGRGRPGWHIECSAMSMKYLGPSFDIHTGGVDNIFPHHEDEIAQSEAATGQPFATYWLHCAHLMVDGQKMSKSRGNFYTLRDVLAQGYTGREIRYELLATHYRAPLNFTFASLVAARTALRRIDEFTARLAELAQGAAAADLPGWADTAALHFEAAMDDDLNISAALAALFAAIREGNAAMDAKTLTPEGAAAVQDLFRRWDTALGVLQKPTQVIPDDVQALLDRRQVARAEKDWAQSDALRDEITARGWTVKDTPKGQTATKA